MQSQFTDKAQNALAQAGRCARGLKRLYRDRTHSGGTPKGRYRCSRKSVGG